MKKLLSFLLSTVCVLGACAPFSACSDAEEKYQVTQQEYEAAFSLQSLSNVTVSMTGPYWERDHIKSYFYNEGENFALCSYSDDTQYYGRYYGTTDGEEFCYLYGSERLADFTEEQARWTKCDNPSAYSDKGINFVLHYRRDFHLLKYNDKTNSYDYQSTAYGEKYVYSYYFIDKKLNKFIITYEADNYEYIWDFYDYGKTKISIEIDGVEPDKIEEVVQLSDILQRLSFEYNVEGLKEKYNFDEVQGYHLIDNAEDYCEFLSDVGVPYEGPFDFLFEDKVIFCYVRCVSGSTDFIPVEYFYYRDTNEIKRKNAFQVEPDSGYPDVVICWCVDIVEVPKTIFERLNAQ